ncbi:thiamine pyrophosphate-binding protein [Halocatena pleomorpha]|uniref:Thiamine pyrophosphate-binding protein n=1 Tax=Halocatena pleomorpha TaxID=1785090 RepID=A0A3P3R308_9EURY|nr:thiamine pyrophosphate-binding protein [Halocatena pleomorpha]RRJ27724.1 thiamine pyrophosphate-binding protein [Halocatena pleomorpha]
MSDSYTGAELFVDTLAEYGVSRVFGNPGTTELPVLNAIAESDLEYVLGLHEDIAVGMAAGYASTRRYHHYSDDASSQPPVGVVNLHITPGVAHGLGNLYAAQWAGAPVVLTAGNHELDFRHEEPLLSGDLKAMVEQFTKFSAEVTDVSALPLLLRRAFRTALTPPTGPVFLGLPMDVMLTETDDAPQRLGAIPNAGRGDPAQIAAAADALTEADDPVLVVGDHVARAGAVDAAVALAEASGARVHGEILACEVNFPGDHDQWISHIPPNEGVASMLMDTDTIVFVGCSTNTTLLRHETDLVEDTTTCVHITDAPLEIGKRQPADVAVIGDPGLVMDDLTTRVQERLSAETHDQRLESVRALKQSLSGMIESMGEDETPPEETRASKADLVDALSAVAPDCFLVDEGVTAKYPLLTRWPLQRRQFLSNKGGGLGYGLPASLGAAFAEGEQANPRDVIGYVGDGSYLYYPHALYTAARYDLDLTVVIPDNRNYRILKDNTNAIFGGTDEDHTFVGMDFDPPVDIVTNAESHGARGHRVETPAEIRPALETALSNSGPDVLDVLVHD